MDVALAAFAALAEDELLSFLGQIGNRHVLMRTIGRVRPLRFIAEDNRAYGNLYDLWNGPTAMHFLPHPVSAVFGLDDRLVEKIGEIIDVNIGTQNHVATPAAVA